MKRFALLVAVVFAILLGFLLAWRLFEIILMFVASLAVAATLRAPIDRLMERRVPSGIAIALVYVLTGLGLLALLFILYQRLGNELAALPEDLGFIYARLVTQIPALGEYSAPVATRFPTPEQMSELLVGDQFGAAVQPLMGFTQNLATTLGNLSLILILSVYWTADRLRFERLALSLLPARRRSHARNIWRSIETGLGQYLRSEMMQSIVAGFVLAPAFMLMGLRYPVFWALAASIAWLVPLVGAFIVIVPLWVVVWVQSGALTATLAVATTLAVLASLEFFLEKRLYSRDRGTNVLLLVVILLMSDAYGLVGLLLAPPIAIAVAILLAELANPETVVAVKPVVRVASVEDLEAELEHVRRLVAETEDTSRRRLQNLADRLGELLEQARQV